MAQNYLIAFGGTGARCVEAVTYLCAAGAITAPLRVLIIDPDQANGNVDLTRQQLVRYHELHSRLSASTEGIRPFFHTGLNEGLDTDSFFWQYPNANQPFGTLIELLRQRPEHQDLLGLLYDEDDIGLSFEQGYIGRAHIGSIDLLQTLQSAVIAAADPKASTSADALQSFVRDLRSAAQAQLGARLLVCGSVFGGTGASGLPAIPPLLRSVFPPGIWEKVSAGCIQVAPYFSFPSGGDGAPDSALHALATQAALYHYAHTDVGYKQVYLVGAPSASATSTSNRLGGAGQLNRPHYAELGAALAMAHFFDPAETVGADEVFASGARSIEWNSLPHAQATHMRKRMAAFRTFCWLHVHFMYEDLRRKYHSEAKWARDLSRVSERSLGGQEPELRTLRDFGSRFLDWSSELQNDPEVRLFGKHEVSVGALGALVEGGKENPDSYHEIVHELSRIREVPQTTAIGWYLDAMTRANTSFCAANYDTWWK